MHKEVPDERYLGDNLLLDSNLRARCKSKELVEQVADVEQLDSLDRDSKYSANIATLGERHR